MKIPRKILNSLSAWKVRKGRLPLIFKGVRQVGKTEAVTDFGSTNFPDFLKVDLERDQGAAAVFRATKNPLEILQQLQILTGQKLSSEGLLFIDEVHACPPALTSLKYFAEDLPHQAVIAAGSHLGILLAGISDQENYSFPVGKVEFMELAPVSFDEYARYFKADEALKLARGQVIEQRQPVSEPIHALLWNLWKQYLITGGLPQVITDFSQAAEQSFAEGFAAARVKQDQLITAYEADIAKHCGKVNAQHIIRVLRAIPAKLASAPHEHTQRFTFKDVVPGIRGYDRLSGALDWLTSSGLAIRLPLVKMPVSPLKGFSDEHLFKLFMFDAGILGALAGIHPSIIYQFNFGMYKGYFAESYVLQELIVDKTNLPLVSWYTNDAEVEFVFEGADGVIPVEVKSSHKFTSRSLASFERRFNPLQSFILSANQGSYKGTRIELPIYLAAELPRLSSSF